MSSKQRFGTTLPPELIERLQNTVAGLQQEIDRSLTVSRFVTSALEHAIHRAEIEHHEGMPWPDIDAPLRRGPRL